MNGTLSRNALSTPESIFKECLFRVPDYQRGYAWEQRQRAELLEDLDLLGQGKAHYAGTLVLYAPDRLTRAKDKRGSSYAVVEVVDGQQRLTTLVILLDALRESLEAEGQTDLAEGLKDRYVAVPGPDGALVSKVTLNRDCQGFFFERVVMGRAPVAGATIRSHQNLEDAWQQFREYLAGKKQMGPGYLPWLQSLRDKICQQLFFTVYVVGETAEVGVIFEVMNNRGLHITELEKVKNYLLYLASKLELDLDHRFADLVNETWAHIFESLMSGGLGDTESEDRLLRMHWLMAYEYSPKKWEGSKSVKDHFHLGRYAGRHEDLLQDLTAYVRSLRDSATVLCDIENPRRADAFNAYGADARIRQQIARTGEKLRRLGVLAPFTPLLMAIRLRFPADGEAYLRALDLCERFSFRVYSFLGYRADAGRTTLFMLGNALYCEAAALNQTLGLLAALIHKYSPEGEFSRRCEMAEGRNWYEWRGLKYLLYEYEEHLAAGRPVEIPWSHFEGDLKKQTIEHILPQAPEPQGYWTDKFTPEDRERCTHDLGNLCLTYDNGRYGRKPFPEKKGSLDTHGYCYANGTLFIERELARCSDWTVDALTARRAAIVEWAKKRWEAPPLTSGATEIESAPAEAEADDQESEA